MEAVAGWRPSAVVKCASTNQRCIHTISLFYRKRNSCRRTSCTSTCKFITSSRLKHFPISKFHFRDKKISKFAQLTFPTTSADRPAVARASLSAVVACVLRPPARVASPRLFWLRR